MIQAAPQLQPYTTDLPQHKYSNFGEYNTQIVTEITAAFQYLKGACKKDGEGLFTRARNDRTRGNGFKL